MSKLFAVGAYANQRLNLAANGKAHGRDAKASNRTWEIRPSGIIGGLGKRGHGGIVNPPRNRKGETGSPPPNAHASEFYPNPELNPVEYLWSHWKQHELPNFCPQGFGQLGTHARRALRRMHRRSSLICAFWEQAELFPL